MNTQLTHTDPEHEDDIRDYAYHLYVQSGCIPGRDLDNWLEAKACLSACVPISESHTRLQRQSPKRKARASAGAGILAA
jgi:hypothetical protein